MRTALIAAAAALVLAAAGAAPAAADDPVTYHTYFQDPGAVPGQDFSLERHAIALIDATPPGERITFAFRDFNRDPVADALIAAHDRGVEVDGVIDGGERGQLPVQRLVAALGPDHAVLCGAPGFEFNSCIAYPLRPGDAGLQHNKFLTFSRLEDGRADVVLETSENFLFPSQYSYYNDMVEIDGDGPLYGAYLQYVADLKAQVRSNDYFHILPSRYAPNTIFLSPRAQPDFDHDDTIVDRLKEIDCSQGGSPTGHGLIRVANMAFRTERAVIMRELVKLHRAGCDVEVILSNADGDILAGLVSAGIPVHPFFLRALRTAPTRPQVIVHDKFFLVDAKSTLTGARTKITYAGTSNWRADEQYSDDLLLRIIDDGVYDAYNGYWELIRSRAASDQSRPASESVAPSSVLTVSPTPNGAGWNRSDVTVRVAASDGHNVNASGLKRLHVEMSGAQTGSWDFPGETDGYNVQELPITAEGTTTVTLQAEDNMGNLEPRHSYEVRIDKTAPTIAGLPHGCELWPPDNQMVHVADISAGDKGSGLYDLSVTSSSDALSDDGDIAISGGSVDLRAQKAEDGATRTYQVTATAADVAGNLSTASGTCVVPRSQGDADLPGVALGGPAS
jgi:hypothetical protein